MADNIFDKARITDEEWEKLKIGRLNPRPNAKNSYGAASFNAEQTKSLFDAQGDLLKEKHHVLINSLKEVGEEEAKRQEAEANRQKQYYDAENDRNAAYEQKETQRDADFNAAQEARQATFNSEEAKRKAEFDASFAEIKTQYDALSVVQEPGNSKTSIMSQDAVTKYVPKVKSKNLANLTFEHARIITSNGQFEQIPPGWGLDGKAHAAAPEYIEVTSGEKYTLSWKPQETPVYMYVFMYDENKEYGENFYSRADFIRERTVQIPSWCCYIRIYYNYDNTPWEDLVLEKFQIELGDTATWYVTPKIIDPDTIDITKQLNSVLGEVEKGLDYILYVQNSFIGGDV